MTDTFGTMLDRIADEISRSDLDTQTRKCIKSAIKHYERKRFYFLESYSTTFNTVASQEYYGSSDSTDIPNFGEIDSVVVTVTGMRDPLTKKTKAWFDNISSTTSITGIPSNYLYYALKLRLYPILNGAYSIRVDGTRRLDDLSATTDTNVWMTEGEELIRQAAKRRLFADYLKDNDGATTSGVQEKLALDGIVEETIKRASTTVAPTQF